MASESTADGSSVGAKILAALLLAGGVGIVIGAGYGIIVAFGSIDPQIAATTLTAAATVIVGVFTVVASRAFEKRKSIEVDQRARWASIYEEFMAGIIRIFELDTPADKRTGASVDASVQFLADFTTKVTIWGSDSVLSEWISWKGMAMALSDSDATALDTRLAMFQLEALIRAMRKDLGHKDKSLGDGDILRLLFADFDQELLELTDAPDDDSKIGR